MLPNLTELRLQECGITGSDEVDTAMATLVEHLQVAYRSIHPLCENLSLRWNNVTCFRGRQWITRRVATAVVLTCESAFYDRSYDRSR